MTYMSKQTKECSRMQENNKAEHSGTNGNMRGSKEQTEENMGRRLSDTMLNRNKRPVLQAREMRVLQVVSGISWFDHLKWHSGDGLS